MEGVLIERNEFGLERNEQKKNTYLLNKKEKKKKVWMKLFLVNIYGYIYIVLFLVPFICLNGKFEMLKSFNL